MKSLLSLLIVIMVGVGVAGYFGFVPGLSKVFGTDKPRDLDVKYTLEEYKAYNERAKYSVKSVKESDVMGTGIVFSGASALNTSFSQQELSGRLNYSEWKYMPVSNTQLRINSDGSVEFSANLQTDRLAGFIKAVGGVNYTPEEVNKALEILDSVAKNPPIYAKFQAEIKDNKLDLVVEKVEVGRLAVPLDKIGGSDAVEALAQEIIDRTPGLDVKSVTFVDGKMNFVGTAPALGTVVTE